jgi:hypothetical protein
MIGQTEVNASTIRTGDKFYSPDGDVREAAYVNTQGGDTYIRATNGDTFELNSNAAVTLHIARPFLIMAEYEEVTNNRGERLFHSREFGTLTVHYTVDYPEAFTPGDLVQIISADSIPFDGVVYSTSPEDFTIAIDLD